MALVCRLADGGDADDEFTEFPGAGIDDQRLPPGSSPSFDFSNGRNPRQCWVSAIFWGYCVA
ncbi:hypothetical protein SB861_53305, partial [Paraburkholderia sp. SIMBA_049]